MSSQVGTNFLLMSLTLLALLVATQLLSRGIIRDRLLFTRTVGLALGCLGTLQIGLSLLLWTNVSLIDLTSDPFELSAYLLFGLFLFLTAIACQPLFFSALRLTRSAYRVVVIGLMLALILLVVAVKLIALNDHYLVRLTVIHSFTTGIALWLVIELGLQRRSAPTPILNILFVVAAVVCSVNAAWVGIILAVFFRVDFFAFSYEQINQWDLHFRFLRGSLFLVSEIVIFIYWLQTQSTIALAEAKNKESISNLLAEKDRLISHLVNTRALVETGALSAGVAHELNQFLTRIQINSEEADSLIEKNTISEKARDSLVRIQDSVRAASEVITGIKKLFSKTNPEFSFIPVDQFLTETVDIYAERARRSEISIDVSLSAKTEWFVSEILLRQVIGNLISNAIDSLDSVSRPQKKILIKSFVMDRLLRIDVIDNGPGVPVNKIQNLFSLFTTSKNNGAGVGLWLSKSIIEQHAGRIYYAEGLEGEAIFSIEIPASSTSCGNKL